MALMRFDPFRELDRLADQALLGARTMRTMPMEALRRGDQFMVAIDVPGVNPSDIDVTVERNVIEINARRQPLRQEGDEVIIDERPQGEFRRQLFLGDNLDPNKLTDRAGRRTRRRGHLLRGDIAAGGVVRVEVEGGELAVNYTEAAIAA